MVGNVTPEMIATGSPIAKTGEVIAKGAARYLPQALAKYAPAIGDVAANAAHEAGKAAYKGEDVPEAAAWGGVEAARGNEWH